MLTKPHDPQAEPPEPRCDDSTLGERSAATSRRPTDWASALCDQFVDRWRRGEPTRAETFLADHPEIVAGSDDECELIYTEYLLREEDDRAPTIQEYIERFPAQADRLRRQLALHRLMGEADPGQTLERSADLGSHEDAPSLVIAPSPHRWPSPTGYRIERVLGRGGMGVVYQARQLRLNRIVALKMIRAGGHASPDISSVGG